MTQLQTWDNVMSMGGMDWRQPLIYDAQNDTAHIGPPSTLHSQLAIAANLATNPYQVHVSPGFHTGIIGSNPITPDKRYVQWYNTPPANLTPVMDALRQRYPEIHDNKLEDDAGWGETTSKYRPKHIATEHGPIKVVPVDPDRNIVEPINIEDGFNGRVPLLWHPESKSVFMGGPDWYHNDTYEHHGIEWDPDHYREGYIGSPNPIWGGGELGWYGTPPPEHDAISQAITTAYPGINTVQNKAPEWKDEDWSD